jgi:hypothetical protein
MNPAPMIAIVEERIWADSDKIEETMLGLLLTFESESNRAEQVSYPAGMIGDICPLATWSFSFASGGLIDPPKA